MAANKKLSPILIILELVFVLVVLPTMPSQAQEGWKIYFGDLHSHTSYSDGTSTPAQAYQHTKNSGVGDFLAVSDHAHMLSNAEWADTKIQADNFTDANFVSIAGFEFTTVYGDLGTYNTEWFMDGSLVITPTAYYDYLVANRPGSIVQWNHPSSANGGIVNYTDYNASRDTVVELLEIVNRTSRYEASYIRALDAGWHIGPTAGQDNHNPNCGLPARRHGRLYWLPA